MRAELPIVLDHDERVPLATQLAERLRAAIHHGILAPDIPLPSTRRLADDLGVSRGVVVRAYEQLAGEGYLEAHGAAGTRVAVRPSSPRPGEPSPSMAGTSPEPAAIDLTPGRPSGRPFLNREWRAAWSSATGMAASTVLPPAEGLEQLRTAIAGHLGAARGLAVIPEQVVVTAGTSDALQLVVAALRTRSTSPPRVLVEDPGYPTARRVLAAAGAVVETLPVDEDGLRVDQLRPLTAPPDVVLVTPSHQYPLGGHMSVQNRLGLLEWAAQHRVLVLEDDYDSEFRHRRMPLPAVASLPTDADVALIGSFSKTLSPSLRCGYLIVDGRDLGQQIKDIRRALDPSVSAPLQSALAHYIEIGGLSRHVARARREYSHRRSILLARLGTRSDVELSALDGGLHAVARLATAIDAEVIAGRALALGVRVVPLARYYANREPENGLVIGYGATTDLELTAALDTLCRLFDEVSGEAVSRLADSRAHGDFTSRQNGSSHVRSLP